MHISLPAISFLLHVLIETPASLTFILRPQSQLSPLPPAAALILQSFGGLLLSLNLVAIVFVRRTFDPVARHVAAAFAFWHLWPCYRAFVRLSRDAEEKVALEAETEKTEGPPSSDATSRTLGGPAIHLVVHLTLFTMFLGCCVLGDTQGSSIASI